MLNRSLYESTDTPAVDDILTTVTGELAFDIGANGGMVASQLAANFTTVIACEPSPAPFDKLVEYAPPNVQPLNVAVSDKDGRITLQYREFSFQRGYLFTGNSLEEWGNVTGELEVEAVTLTDLAAMYGIPDFVKIDTEGHELRVAQGGVNILRHTRYVIEVHDREHGVALAGLLGDHETIRHASRGPDTDGYQDHYWMVSL